MSSIDHQELIAVAAGTAGNAYAPYSDFRTGAACLGEDGSVHVGALVENLVFGAAMCAERVAMFSAVAAGTRPTILALVAPDTAGEITFPCGFCLQVAIELGGPELTIVAASADDPSSYQSRTVDELAPGIPRRKGRPK